MASITLELPAETERKLRDRADREGQAVETLVREIVVQAANSEPVRPRFMTHPPRLTPERFQRILEDIAAGEPGTPLPPDFSRADIYPDDE
ncbi:MAG: hypothetical protein U0791_19695 [Gemmataceae bacterium]